MENNQEQPKKKRGRPAGSKNKPKGSQVDPPASPTSPPRAPGRPRKNKNEQSPTRLKSKGFTGTPEAQELNDSDLEFSQAMLDGRFSIKRPEKKKDDKWTLGTPVKFMLGDEWEHGWYCGASGAEKGMHIVKSKKFISMVELKSISLDD